MPREMVTLQCTDVQGEELHDHQEQEDDDGASGVQQVLSALPQAQAHKEIK